MMKKRTVIGLWLTVILVLILLSNTIPTLQKATEEKDYTYTHPKDGYTLNIKGTWQVAAEKEKKLLLVDTEHDCTVSFHLEVGGFDYLTPENTAKKLYQYLKKEVSDVSIIDGPTEGTVNGYQAIAFLAKFTENNTPYYAEIAVLHPNEGIRLYSVFIYPKGLKKELITKTETMINTIQFKDTEKLYAKYI